MTGGRGQTMLLLGAIAAAVVVAWIALLFVALVPNFTLVPREATWPWEILAVVATAAVAVWLRRSAADSTRWTIASLVLLLTVAVSAGILVAVGDPGPRPGSSAAVTSGALAGQAVVRAGIGAFLLFAVIGVRGDPPAGRSTNAAAALLLLGLLWTSFRAWTVSRLVRVLEVGGILVWRGLHATLVPLLLGAIAAAVIVVGREVRRSPQEVKLRRSGTKCRPERYSSPFGVVLALAAGYLLPVWLLTYLVREHFAGKSFRLLLSYESNLWFLPLTAFVLTVLGIRLSAAVSPGIRRFEAERLTGWRRLAGLAGYLSLAGVPVLCTLAIARGVSDIHRFGAAFQPNDLLGDDEPLRSIPLAVALALLGWLLSRPAD